MLMFSFCLFLLMFLVLGLSSFRRSAGTEQDYFLAGQNTPPQFLAFSACASKYSGYMFIGFMGYAFSNGVDAMWMLLGLMVADLSVYYPVAKRLRAANAQGWALSYNEILTFWRGEDYIWLRRLSGLLTLVFLFVYAAAQLKAGGKALQVVLGFPLELGVFLSSILVLLYCWAGGIRAAIWTDVLQLMVMFVALTTILIVTISTYGGFGGFWEAVGQVPGGYGDWMPEGLAFSGMTGFSLFLIGWMAAGACVLGQPHVMVRAMALPSVDAIRSMFKTYVLLDLVLGPLFFLVGLCAHLLLGSELADPELALPMTAVHALWPAFAGLVLAGVFASSMSTADSQILCCSSSLTRDFSLHPKNNLALSKLATVTVTVGAAAIALFAGQNVFVLVIFAWTGLGAALGPVMVLKVYNVHLPQWGAIAASLAGGSTVVLWQVLGYGNIMESAFPGVVAGFLTAWLSHGVDRFMGAEGHLDSAGQSHQA